MTKYVKVSSMKMFIQVAEDKPNVEVKPTNPAKTNEEGGGPRFLVCWN